MAEKSIDLCMHNDLNGVVVEDSEDSSGWADSAREAEISSGFVPDSEISSGFVPDSEISSGFVPDSEISSGFVPDSEIPSDFVPDSEILPGFVPEVEILPDFIPNSELQLVPVSENEVGLKGRKRLRSEHLDRRGEASNDSFIDIYLRPVHITNLEYFPPASAHADPDPKVQERVDAWVSMWLPLPKK
ncbi:unnamed protein product [Cuscuta epithymum]|uniref:Uncharacterized protein n=1 Tax=Cuscuta epithymum TaxID=186058 RepID=A0AAV0FQX7_9ASTE|nr:unnamed protein product [Cuscuta epithymum]